MHTCMHAPHACLASYVLLLLLLHMPMPRCSMWRYAMCVYNRFTDHWLDFLKKKNVAQEALPCVALSKQHGVVDGELQGLWNVHVRTSLAAGGESAHARTHMCTRTQNTQKLMLHVCSAAAVLCKWTATLQGAGSLRGLGLCDCISRSKQLLPKFSGQKGKNAESWTSSLIKFITWYLPILFCCLHCDKI